MWLRFRFVFAAFDNLSVLDSQASNSDPAASLAVGNQWRAFDPHRSMECAAIEKQIVPDYLCAPASEYVSFERSSFWLGHPRVSQAESHSYTSRRGQGDSKRTNSGVQL